MLICLIMQYNGSQTVLDIRDDLGATYKTKDFYMGRTLDYEFSYGEQITITPRNYEFDFRFAGKIKSHYALIGMAFVAGGYPLLSKGEVRWQNK